MRYTRDDVVRAWHISHKVKSLMEAVIALEDAGGFDDDQDHIMPMADQTMVKAYNTLHEYVMYREQRMREEENEEG